MDFIFTSANLLILWIVAGVVCFLPLVSSHSFFKYASVVVVLGTVYTTFLINEEFIGRPRDNAYVEEFIYKGHTISQVGSKKYITMWIHDGTDDLLIRMPHTDEQEKDYKKARARHNSGILQKGTMRNKKKNPSEASVGPDVEIFDFPFQQMFPKDSSN